MFQDFEPKAANFVSSWKAQKKITEHSSQTSETITYEAGNQTNPSREAQCQTESLLQLMQSTISLQPKGEDNATEISAFLKKVEPAVSRQLKINNATVDLYSTMMKARKGDFENSISCEYCLREKATEGSLHADTPVEVTSVSWSRTGASVAVSYGSNENMSWSEDASYICVWNLDRPKLKLDESDQKLELESSVQTVMFHPETPGFIAAGLFSGVVLVWDLSKDEVSYSNSAHDDPVTCLCWMESGDKKTLKLMSSSTDGRFIIWKFKKGKVSSLLKFEKEYQVSSTSIPRRFGVKGRGNLGITCFCPARNADMISNNITGRASKLLTSGAGIIAGLENGLVLKCSTDLPELNPVTFVYESHKGPVYSVDWSPFHRNLFLTCSTDQSCRIYHALEAAPLREIRTGSVGGRAGASLISACWSFTRPTLFYAAGSAGKLEAYDFTASHVVSSVDVGEKKDEQGTVNAIQLNPSRCDLIVSGSSSGYIHVWRLGGGLVSGTATLQSERKIIDELAREAMARD